jgi:hypothetical protein
MSNKKSNHLYELIKSLNKTEKRYFKLYSSRHTIGEQNNYISLFDFISKMELYDEELIMDNFKGEPFLNNFSITKGRLYTHILNALDLYYSTSSIDAQLYKTIHSADILFNKGLYQQSEKILNSVEKQAKKHGKELLLLEIKNKQKKLIEKESYSELKKNQLALLFEEEQQIVKEIEKYQLLWHTKSVLFNELNLRGHIRSEDQITSLKTMIDSIKSVTVKNSSPNIKYLFHHIHSAYYFAVNDLEKCYVHILKSKALVEDNTLLFEDTPNTYFSLITNLIFIATKLKKYKESALFLSILKSIPESKKYISTTDLDIKYFSSIYSLELFLMIEQSDYDGATLLIPKIQKGYSEYGTQINSIRKAYIDFKIAIVYLSTGQFEEALQWITEILNAEGLDKKQDIYCFAQIINLILHFELKNIRFLPYALNSTKRYLKGRNKLFKFEELFLKIIGKISKSDLNKFEIEDILIPIEKELFELKNDHYEQIVFDYFDFATWVKSKIEGKTYLELKQVG